MTEHHPWERMLDAVVDGEFEHHFPEPDIPVNRKMGHAVAHHPVLSLKNYIEEEVDLPSAVRRTQPGGTDAWLNDTLSDCGEGMTLNGIQTFDAETGRPITPFVDGDAEALYEPVGGYNPDAPLVNGQNPTDQGTDNNKLVAYWKDPGVLCAATGERHQIIDSLFVEPTEYMTKLCIWEFVVNFRAYGLPQTAEQQKHWELVDGGNGPAGALGGWGYHDVAQFAYGPYNVVEKTWGMDWMSTWAFDGKYAVQGFAVVTKEQTNLQGVSPAGINWTRLNQDLADLRASQKS